MLCVATHVWPYWLSLNTDRRSVLLLQLVLELDLALDVLGLLNTRALIKVCVRGVTLETDATCASNNARVWASGLE